MAGDGRDRGVRVVAAPAQRGCATLLAVTFPPHFEERSMAATLIPEAEMLDQKGRKFPPGPCATLDQSRIDTFADCTEDHQFIHIDQERAAQTHFGGTIAHGFPTLSMLSKLCEGAAIMPENVVMALNYGFNKVRFLAPVRAGKRVRAHLEILDVNQKDDKRFLVTPGITVGIEGEQTPALVAEWLAMMVTA
jgi:acyl dehydratase